MSLFTEYMFTYPPVGTLGALWKRSTAQHPIEKTMFSIPAQNNEESNFKVKYDQTQLQLQSIAAMDDLLSGILFL